MLHERLIADPLASRKSRAPAFRTIASGCAISRNRSSRSSSNLDGRSTGRVPDYTSRNPRLACALLDPVGALPHNDCRSRGFTLVEMVITFLVLGLRLAFSIPAFQEHLGSYRLKGRQKMSPRSCASLGRRQSQQDRANDALQVNYPPGNAV
jgi:hypothetical protein